ncbi:MAG: hypothetical protein KAH16_04430 [Candidatus Izimaplasma sp.]|nr:hypothetical protein [Candidatus Izimaplasma bacterium]
MTKRQIIKIIKREYETKKRNDFSHDIILFIKGKKYYVKIVNIASNNILSFNSQYIWEIKKGRISGIRFIQYSSTLINLKAFMKLEDRIIFLTHKPYKMLKQINEADIINVSNENLIHNTLILTNPFLLSEIE